MGWSLGEEATWRIFMEDVGTWNSNRGSSLGSEIIILFRVTLDILFQNSDLHST